MKKFLVILAVTFSGFGFGQTEFEVIPQFKNLFDNGGFGELQLANDASVYIYSKDNVQIIPVSKYLNSFEFNKYLNDSVYEIEFQVNDEFVALISDPDVPEDLTVVGYSESIVIKNINTNKAILSITVFYQNNSSLISGVSVFTSTAIIN